MMRKIERESKGTMAAGQDLVMTGYAGHAGTVEIIKKKRPQLERWFDASYLEAFLERTNQVWNPGHSFGVTEWEASGEGGILKTLWDLSGAYETGIRFALRRILVCQETIEVCERLEINPYRLYADGCYVLVCDHGGQLVEYLRERQIPAAVIGCVTSGNAREMVGGGTTGYLERPQPDEIKKILQEGNP